MQLKAHIANDTSNAGIVFTQEYIKRIEDADGSEQNAYQYKIFLDEQNALRLGAFHNIVAKLIESDDGWFLCGNDDTNGLLSAQDEHYNLVAIRHFFKNGLLGEARIKASVNSFEKTVTDICLSYNSTELPADSDKWIQLEEAIHNPDAVVEDINAMVNDTLDFSDGAFDFVNLHEMPIDHNIIKQMTMQPTAENIKVVSFNENMGMTITYNFQSTGFTKYQRADLDVNQYLSIAKQNWQSFLR